MGRSPTGLGFDKNPTDHSFPIDLIRFSIRAEKRKKNKYHTPQASYSPQHAAPLISINHRDVTTLDELFLRDDIAEIANDINIVLQKFLPAPCWEDDPFEVVKILMETKN
ncbi:hypothetical protein NIES208_13975 [[Limnothrix rosea] IAM M-220]|nr:hypothetical protein NIES208_13975 [[Limnothrix rosea] IAM M-220]